MKSLRLIMMMLILVGGITLQLHAQDVQATAKVDSNNIRIGDWLKLHLEVSHPADISVSWPSISDSLKSIEIVGRDSVNIQKSGNTIVESKTLTITSFDSGTVVVPPLPFRYSTAGDTAKKTVETSPIPIFVHTVQVDTSKEIKDIKPPLDLSITFAEVLPYLIALVVAGLAVWLFFYIRKKRQRGESIIPETPRKPPHEIALNELRSLDSEHMWQRGMIKEYHSRLTDILRIYLEGRFGIMAMEMTTDEIMDSLSSSDISKEMKAVLREILVRADFAKFAKFQPVPHENEESMKLANSFVEGTWRKVTAQVPLLETPASEVRQ